MTHDPDQIETIAAPVTALPQPRTQRSRERFPPGTLLASRYRIVSRLGKGGMGEVFRADDLILGQAVALKFLPEAAKSNVNLLTRFYDEVRIARQISHKNVCRVYDIGEIDSQPYLSMEYIDGEDLGSLLRRIGRLPSDKATEFARKLCAGVAAAHAEGVLHRDLKPANIMIDARGELRVTDFGLAAIAPQLQGDEIRNGTPAYMAPEQLTGKDVSVQSDLYAVGLMEMFTGKMPFEADTIADMTRKRQESRIVNPTTLVGDLDKNVERAILRCLEPDPKMRPASAMALAASLPGGDPLAAALADGVTPSPEVVAAAGTNEGLSPKIAIPALAGIAVGLLVFCLVTPRQHILNLVPMENPPEVLAAKARELAQSLGYKDRAADSISGFFGEGANINYLIRQGNSMEEWARLFAQPPTGIGYWYRQGPGVMASERSSSRGEPGVLDPPVSVPGMISVTMELDSTLRRFTAIPPEREAAPADPQPTDWSPLFAAARLDPNQLKPADPEWTPLIATETRAAWTGDYPGRPDLKILVEAASFHGKPVYFQVLWPWTRSTRLTPTALSTAETLRRVANYAIEAIILIVAIWVAHYNWKSKRGDLRGATRIGLYCACMSLVAWVFRAHHVASEAEQQLLDDALSNAALLFVEFWLLYLALEPWVRRYWPQTMITWSRVLAGKWRDPMVGRDVLFGVLFGFVYLMLLLGYGYINARHGSPSLAEFRLGLLGGLRPFSVAVVTQLYGEVGGSLAFFMTLFLVRAVLKKQWLAGAIWVIGWTAVRILRSNTVSGSALFDAIVFWLLLFSLLGFIMLRLGFFALIVANFTLDTAASSFFTTDFSAWYGESSLAIVILIGAIAILGFKLSLGSRTLLDTALET